LKDRKKIERALDTLELIHWINNHWMNAGERGLSEIYLSMEKESPEIIILTHWVTYINDRLKKVKGKKGIETWKKWVDFFGSVIKFYIENIKIKGESVNDFYLFKKKFDEYENNLEPNRQLSRKIPQDWANIIFTLWILGKFFDKSFLTLIEKILSLCIGIQYKTNENELRLIAYILSLLSYSVAYNKKKIEEHKIINKNKFNEISKFFKQLSLKNKVNEISELILTLKSWNNWKRTKRFNSKRLMACLRDLKLNSYFKIQFTRLKNNIKISKKYPNIFKNEKNFWEELNLDGLELPGDRWNLRFFLPAVIKACTFKVDRRDNNSELTRKIYQKLKELAIENKIIDDPNNLNYYPIDMDFTFEFSEKYCDNNKCEICPFGPYGFKCTLNDINCEFLRTLNIPSKCIDKEKCPIFNNKGIGMCGLAF